MSPPSPLGDSPYGLDRFVFKHGSLPYGSNSVSEITHLSMRVSVVYLAFKEKVFRLKRKTFLSL